MPEINISNAAGRDAVVNMESVMATMRVRWVDQHGRQARNIRILKSTLNQDIDSLQQAAEGIDNVADQLIHADPDVDIEAIGTFLTTTSRVYVNSSNEIVHRVQQFEIIKNPDGSIRDRRVLQRSQQNVSGEIPIKWSGIYVKRSEVVHKFVFANKLQLFHINGLTYDFLFAMAKDLESRDSMLLVGAGPRSSQPLVLRRGSIPYRGFLEGRTRGDKFLLILHLSNLELKSPEQQQEIE
jgi:hypothetical protein